MRKGFKFCDGRAVYECVNSPERCLWYAAPYWYVGPTRDLGKPQGWLCCKVTLPLTPSLTRWALLQRTKKSRVLVLTTVRVRVRVRARARSM